MIEKVRAAFDEMHSKQVPPRHGDGTPFSKDEILLEKCFSLAGSDNDAEALAVRKCRDILARMDMSWVNLVEHIGARLKSIAYRRQAAEAQARRDAERRVKEAEERRFTAKQAAEMLAKSAVKYQPATIVFLHKMADASSPATATQRAKIQEMWTANRRQDVLNEEVRLHEDYRAFVEAIGGDYETFLKSRKAAN
ncbi:MAG TPA: hypothetical protein VIL70_06470 [Chthoniobacterales bacterium]|jgi:crotonobetainyl-CoA:carnitine CoA-transferase CaiB-like acyl-CoA transferase